MLQSAGKGEDFLACRGFYERLYAACGMKEFACGRGRNCTNRGFRGYVFDR